MRGTPETKEKTPWQAGIIPADAGNTKLDVAVHGCQPDHPRGCGEHVALVSAEVFE